MVKGGGFHAIGRRKAATARVFMRPHQGEGKGIRRVNGRAFEAYFGRETLQMILNQPFGVIAAPQPEAAPVEGEEQTQIVEVASGTITNYDHFDILVNVGGGGLSGQAGATRLGISRALLLIDITHRKSLKAAGLLTRDAREVERKKYGRHKARRRPQFSKR